MARILLTLRLLSKTTADELDSEYDRIIAQLVRMMHRPEQWLIIIPSRSKA